MYGPPVDSSRHRYTCVFDDTRNGITIKTTILSICIRIKNHRIYLYFLPLRRSSTIKTTILSICIRIITFTFVFDQMDVCRTPESGRSIKTSN